MNRRKYSQHKLYQVVLSKKKKFAHHPSVEMSVHNAAPMSEVRRTPSFIGTEAGLQSWRPNSLSICWTYCR